MILLNRNSIKASGTYVLIWLIAGTIAMVMALQLDTAAFVDGHYIPVGNDSFYHARRILDAAIGERGFYQFDNMIHVPEGSWINWPWAYDYLMAQALLVALWIRPSVEPMAFLDHVPVAWVFVNMGLLTLIGRQIRLGAALTAIGLLGFALLPLTQTLHGLGIIDHHYIELTFVLAAIWAGLRFFSDNSQTVDAVVLGTVLGIAPAFHNGLFILQIPLLVCTLILWLHQRMPPLQKLVWLGAALVICTVLVAIPSAPFRAMQFEFWTLSWFHVYVATCSALSLAFLGWRPVTKPNIGWLVIIALLLLAPVFSKAVTGAAFLSGDLILLESILEVKSPLSRIGQTGGITRLTTFYSWLFFLIPVYLSLFIVRAWRDTSADKVYFSVFAVFGTLLMLTQARLHPFGAWAMLFGSLVLLDEWRERHGISRLVAAAAAVLVVAVAFQPPLKNRLFHSYPPGFTRDYAATRTLFHSLATACAAEGGTVLSYNDDGHHIRYHTDCSVITNNFLLTPLHEKKILEADAMLQMSPEQFLRSAPQVKYVFVRMYEIFKPGPDGMQAVPLMDVIARNAPLFVGLTFSREIPAEFQLIDEVRVDDDRDFAYARVFRIDRDE